MCDPNTRDAPAECNDEQLIAGLEHALARQSGTTARLAAFMAEVDARGLYRGFAYASMFEYAVQALHMSEGEAFPRINAGRVTRKYPVVLQMLERGELHLAGIRLVGPHLTPDNHLELLAAVRFKSKRDIERFVAALCPREDVKSAIRKLPERPATEPQPEELTLSLEPACGHAPSWPSHLLVARGVQRPDSERVEIGAPGAAAIGSAAASVAVASGHQGAPWSEPARATGEPMDSYRSPVLVSGRADGCNQPIQHSADANATGRAMPSAGSHPSTRQVRVGSVDELADPLARHRPPLAPGEAVGSMRLTTPAQGGQPGYRPASASLTPLRAERYKVQFTAGQRLYDKIKQAQHLLRSQIPSGELAEVMERALDVLIAQRMKQRFAVGRKSRPAKSQSPTRRQQPACQRPAHQQSAHQRSARQRSARQQSASPQSASPQSSGRQSASPQPSCPQPSPPQSSRPQPSRHIPSEVRRQVFARDGMQCTYVSRAGRRCEQRADLEYHHVQPFARGGETSVANVRLTCRAHNALFAEHDYGREFIRQRIDGSPRGPRGPRDPRVCDRARRAKSPYARA